MEMEDNIKTIVEKLDDEEFNDNVQLERMILPEERLRNSLLSLVEKQAREANNYDKAIGLAVNSIIDKISTNELTTGELLSVISTLSNKKVDLISGILEPFKPTPNGVSLLLPPVKEKETENDFTDGLNSMSKEELATINKFYNVIKQK